MTGLRHRFSRRRTADEHPRPGVLSFLRGPARGERLPGYRRFPALGPLRLPWGRRAPQPAAQPVSPTGETQQLVAAPPPLGFRDRGPLRRRLRFLRRARELGFRDVGGLIFDMRRFARNRPDLLDAKLDALLAVDEELRSLERILDDRRPLHELREPGISACARCGALHSSEANFCPQCGLQLSGPRAMGELGGAIAEPPQAPPPPAKQVRTTTIPLPADQPTSPTVVHGQPDLDQPTVVGVPVLTPEPEPAPEPEPEPEPSEQSSEIVRAEAEAEAEAEADGGAAGSEGVPDAPRRADDAPAERPPSEDAPVRDAAPEPDKPTRTRRTPRASGGS